MLIIPAIDLKDGQAVRLLKGNYNNKTVYSTSPEKLAAYFSAIKADYLHVVDLDGAKEGITANLETIKKIRQAATCKMELGGGIRDLATVKLYLDDLKIDRIILGTSAINNREFLIECLQKYGPEKIVVGVDVLNEEVLVSGWLESSKVNYLTFIKELAKLGVKYIVVTDISKDGTLQGPNFPLYESIRQVSELNIVVSGGVKDKADVARARELNYYACIIGKAYYEGKIDLEEVIKC